MSSDYPDSHAENKWKEDLRNAGITGAASGTVDQYGSAIKEHFVAFSGHDYETGQPLTKGLKDIAGSKVNPQYQKQNLRQQSGFSAEVKESARYNAKKILEGSAERKVRTDDIGRVNDPLCDHVTLDQNGNIVSGSGAQMKFVGNTPKEAFKKLTSTKYEKYRQAGVKLEVPSDYYEGIQKEAAAEIEKLQGQLARAKTPEQTARLQKKIDDCKVIQNNLQKSEVSSEDAMFARLHPGLSTAQDVIKLSAKAGAQAAAVSAAFAGSISIISNLVAVTKGEKPPKGALVDVAKNTGSAAAIGALTGFAGSALKGAMQNAASESIRTLSRTNLAATAVTATLSASKSLSRYVQGEISGVQCFEELGEEGCGMVSSAMFAVIGQAAIPIPIVGAAIGSMIGYSLASASYSLLLQSQKEAQLAHEERLRIEEECSALIQMIRSYRAELEQLISNYLTSNMQSFQEAFDGIKASLAVGDVDGYIAGTNSIAKALGYEVQFSSQDEFDQLMASDTAFRL